MDDVDELIDRSRAKLGDPDGVHRPPSLARALAVGAALTFGTLAVLGLLVWWKPRLILLAKFLWVGVAGGVYRMYTGWAGRGRAVLSYPDGLLPVGRGDMDWYPWAEAGAVVLGGVGAATVTRDDHGRVLDAVVALDADASWGGGSLTLYVGDHPPLVLRGNLSGFPELVVRGQRAVFDNLWPSHRATLDAGQTVEYGSFAVARGGLTHKERLVPWDELTAFELTPKGLSARWRGQWLAPVRVDLDELVNPHLLLAAVEHCRRPPAADSVEGKLADL